MTEQEEKLAKLRKEMAAKLIGFLEIPAEKETTDG